MTDLAELRQKLLERLRQTFPGPEITDALCNAEQLAGKYGVTADDKDGIGKCVAEAVELTFMEMQGERRHTCPEEGND